MRYVVIGAGAVGGTVGARLHEAGREVMLVARGPHLAAIRRQGLCLDEPGRSRTLRLPAVGHVSEVGWQHNDVVLLCTKTQDSESVLDALLAVAPGVPVSCAQNGVANERFVASRFAEVQSVCVMLPAEHLMPGRVVAYSTPTPGILDVGVFPHGVDRLTEQIVGDVRAAVSARVPTARSCGGSTGSCRATSATPPRPPVVGTIPISRLLIRPRGLRGSVVWPPPVSPSRRLRKSDNVGAI